MSILDSKPTLLGKWQPLHVCLCATAKIRKFLQYSVIHMINQGPRPSFVHEETQTAGCLAQAAQAES